MINRSKQRSTQKIFGEGLGLCCCVHIKAISNSTAFLAAASVLLELFFHKVGNAWEGKTHISAIFHLCSRINFYLLSHIICYLWELMGFKLGVMASSCSKTVIDFNVKLCRMKKQRHQEQIRVISSS